MASVLKKLFYSYFMPCVYALAALLIVAVTVDFFIPYESAEGGGLVNEQPLSFRLSRKIVSPYYPNYRVKTQVDFNGKVSESYLIHHRLGGQYSSGDIQVYISENPLSLFYEDKFRCTSIDLSTLSSPVIRDGPCQEKGLQHLGVFTDESKGTLVYRELDSTS